MVIAQISGVMSAMANILVLDDMLDAVMLIRRVLERKGHDVFCFTEEEKAVSFAKSHAIDLVILDIRLKKMSGIEVLEELRKIGPNMRVLMLTGYPSLDTAQEAARLGADEYCVKPIEQQELEEKIEAILALEPGR